MANKRITDLPENLPLVGTEALVMDQESILNATGYDTVQATLSSIQEFTLSAAPFLNVAGDSVFQGGVDVLGNTILYGGVDVEQELTVTGDVSLDGNIALNGDVTVNNGDFNVSTGQILSGDRDLIDIFGIPAFIGNLQQVTDLGNNTTNDILINGKNVIINESGVDGIQRLTQAEYDGLPLSAIDPFTLYVIVG